MAVLPYMDQPARDYALKLVITPAPTPTPTPVPTPSTPPTIEVSEGMLQIGGPWYGDTPPDNPSNGWLWVNSANNGLYTYTNPGIWTQIGTNW